MNIRKFKGYRWGPLYAKAFVRQDKILADRAEEVMRARLRGKTITQSEKNAIHAALILLGRGVTKTSRLVKVGERSKIGPHRVDHFVKSSAA